LVQQKINSISFNADALWQGLKNIEQAEGKLEIKRVGSV